MLRNTVLLVAICISVSLCHICFIDPPQRGKQLTGIPGDPACYRRTPYCGGIPIETPVTTYKVNEPVLIHFQQNLNHWFSPRPGHLDFSISYTNTPTDDDFIVLKTFSDFAGHEMVVSTNFTFVLTFPRGKTCDHCILRARYVSNNPLEISPKNNTDARFYNCVDFKIVDDTDGDEQDQGRSSMEIPELQEEKVVAKKSVSSSGFGCTTVPQWEGTMTETRKEGKVFHHLWYDAVEQRLRWDRSGAISPYYQQLTTYYITKPSLVEYLHFPTKGQCLAYGPDAWYDWSYGASVGQALIRNDTISGTKVYVWGTDQFEWITTVDCEPVGKVQLGLNQVEFLWTSFKKGVDASAFALPSGCGNKKPQSDCGATEEQIKELLSL